MGSLSMVMLVFGGVTFQVFNKINFWGGNSANLRLRSTLGILHYTGVCWNVHNLSSICQESNVFLSWTH